MNAITIPYVLSILATVFVGRLISIIIAKKFKNIDTQFMNFEILTRIPLFLIFFVSTALALQTPAITIGALSIASFAPGALLAYPVALFLGMANNRYGVLKPFNPKDLDAEGAVGVALLYATVELTLATLILLPAGGALLQGCAASAGVAYVAGAVLLYKALSRIVG